MTEILCALGGFATGVLFVGALVLLAVLEGATAQKDAR